MRTETNIEKIWRLHRQEIYDFLASRCGDRLLAEELTSETFLHATRALKSGQEVNGGWLVTVARRRLADHWRASYRALALRQRLEHERSTERTAELEAELDGPVEQALSRLCSSQRSALVLRYASDRSVQQVADRLDLSYAATESLLSRGRRGLAREFQTIGQASRS